MKRSLLVASAIISAALLVACGGAATVAPTEAPTEAPVAAPTEAPAATATAEPAAPVPTTEAAATADSETSTTPANGFQLYRIDPAQSEARYQVDELFFTGNRLATAIGRTNGVSGEIMVDFAQPANTKLGEITIDVSQLASDEGRRDNFIRNMGGLRSSQYPQVKFVPTSIEGMPDSVTAGDSFEITIHGDMTVQDMTKPVSWKAMIKVEDGKVTGSATSEVLMSDFGIGPIEVPMLKTEDKVLLFLDFVAVPA
jgi:polyisoprenoid-binding protein YceI